MDPDDKQTRKQADREATGAENRPEVVCPLPATPDLSGVTEIRLSPVSPLADYQAAMAVANAEATAQLGEHMLLSWYDRDRDFESPQHVSECHQDAAVPGYVDYGVHHGATLKIDVENGRFVFFYMPFEL